VAIDFGLIINQAVINQFEFGIINSHFSLLPEWRGADPITYALLSGQEQTGVSLMLIDAGLDTGNIIAQSNIKIEPSDNNSTLTHKLLSCSNDLLDNYLESFLLGDIETIKQSILPTTFSRKLIKNDGLINWDKPATVIERDIRAFNIWPKSHCKVGQVNVIITQSRVVDFELQIGKFIFLNDNQLMVGCKCGSLEILELMPLGKRPMLAKAFINGYKDSL
jgi:methionyl-tRNA formyltransferase